MNDDIKKFIVDYVDKAQGAKVAELASAAVDYIYNVRYGGDPQRSGPDHNSGLVRDIPALIQALVDSGDLLEVEYVLPKMDYRVKSFYLPKGAGVAVIDSRIRQNTMKCPSCPRSSADQSERLLPARSQVQFLPGVSKRGLNSMGEC